MTINSGFRLLRSAAAVVNDIMKDRRLRGRTAYTYFYKHVPVKDNVVLYESFGGAGMVCNPYAIFLQLLNDPGYSRMKHVWVLDHLKDHSLLLKEYENRKNVVFVRHNSVQYLYYLCCAKYLFNNNSFPMYFTKKKEQISVNTWHGIPLKTLGFDMPDGAEESHNVIRCFLQSDYMLSANSFLTDIYNHAYKLADIYQGKIIEEGYPRLDTLFRFPREQVIEKLKKYGVSVDASKKIILYAPTWKGKSWREADTGAEQFFTFKEKLENLIDTGKYQILVKVHKLVYEKAKNELNHEAFIPASMDANEVLSISDILVSDYSSIFFDYLALGRPILFYMPDLEEYKEERGVYFGTDVLPGPKYTTVENLAEGIEAVEKGYREYDEKYRAAAKWSNAVNNRNIAARVIDIIFEKKEKNYKIYKQNTGKKRVFIYPGPMRKDEKTSALLHILNTFDYDKFDVTMEVTDPGTGEEKEMLALVNKNVRILVRKTAMNLSFGEQVCEKQGAGNSRRNKHFLEAARREYNRFYNDVTFDYVISFEGTDDIYINIVITQNRNARHIVCHSWSAEPLAEML